MVHEVDPRELFSRYEGNPIIKAAAFPRMVNAVFNPAAVMFEGQTLLLMRVEDRSGLSRLVVATSDNGFTDWEVDDDRAIVPRSRLLRGAVGRRGPEDHTRRRRGISHRLYGLLTRRTAGLPRDHERLPHVQETRGDPVSRGQGRGTPPAEVRGSMGPDPPSGVPRRRTRRAYLALLEPRSASLGGFADPASRTQGRVVGRREDRTRAAAAPHRPGVARLLSRRACHGVRLDLPARVGAPRPGRSHRGDRPGQRVGLRTRIRSTNDRATSPTSCSRAAGSSTRTVTRCGCITEPRTASSASRPPASTTSSNTSRTILRSRGRRCRGSTSRPSERSSCSATMAAGGNSVPERE